MIAQAGNTLIAGSGVRKEQEKNHKISENIFAVLMFAATVTCIWQVIAVAVSFYVHLN